MEQQILDIFAHPIFENRAKLFDERYDLIDIKGNDDPVYSKRNLKGFSCRTCRFCGRSYPDTTFSNYSHLQPKLIGNRNMYSDFECDRCNGYFSSLENDLAYYLGISRSITGLNGNKNVPGFSARRLHAKSRSFIGNNILIIAPEDYEREGNKITIRYVKNPYVPANVFKALLKSALSILDEREVKENYGHAIDYLMGKSLISQGALIAGYKLSFQLSLPFHVYHFQKKNKEDNIPTHVMVFHFQNHIIAFPVPLHRQDIPLYKTKYNIIMPPPYFTNMGNMEIAMPAPFQSDLSSINEVSDEEELINLILSENSLKDTWKYDPVTDQSVQEVYNPAGIKYLIFTKEGVTVNPRELSAFIEEQMNRNT
jgi:hypothetical protein